MEEWLKDIILPTIGAITSTVIAIALPWIANILRQRYNLQVEQKDMEALQSAVNTGVNAALARVLTQATQRNPELGNQLKKAVVEEAISHVQQSVPDAMRRLKPPEEVLANIALAKLAQAIPFK